MPVWGWLTMLRGGDIPPGPWTSTPQEKTFLVKEKNEPETKDPIFSPVFKVYSTSGIYFTRPGMPRPHRPGSWANQRNTEHNMTRQRKRGDCRPWGGGGQNQEGRGGGRRAGGVPGRGAPGRTAQGGRGRGGASYCCCAGRGRGAASPSAAASAAGSKRGPGDIGRACATPGN